jgi:hypothetical protein
MDETNASYWHPDDKLWLKARKEQWKQVKKSLDIITKHHDEPKRKYHKYHQELFLYGTINSEVKNTHLKRKDENDYLYTGHDAFEHVLPIFQLWYHPDPASLDLKAFIQPYLNCGTMKNLREILFKFYYNAGAMWHRPMFSSETGMMDGRESLMVKLLCPGHDFNKPVIEVADPNRAHGQGECFHPGMLEHWLGAHSFIELFQDARFIPYAPGQYLWDHFSYALERYPDLVFKPGGGVSHEEKKNFVLNLIVVILDFVNRTDKSRNRPSTIAFVENVMSKYEQKTFSDAMLKLWDEAKQNYQSLRENTSLFINIEEDDLAERGMPIDVQRERVSQWKQV